MSLRVAVLPIALAAMAVATFAFLAGGDEGQPAPPPTTTLLALKGVVIDGADEIVPGAALQLRGSGLPPDLGVVVVPCGSAALERSSATACDYRYAARTTTDGDGALEFTFEVARLLSVDDAQVDCASARCDVSVLALTEPTTELHRQRLSFAAVPDTVFDVRVTPSEGLQHLATVEVDGAWDAAIIELCAADHCDLGSRVEARSAPVDFRVPAAIVTGAGETRVCGDGACAVRVTTDQGMVETPVSFAGEVAPFQAHVRDGDPPLLELRNLLGTWYRADLCEVAFLAGGESVPCETVTRDAIWGPADVVSIPIAYPRLCEEICELRVRSGAGDTVVALVEAPIPVVTTPPAPTALRLVAPDVVAGEFVTVEIDAPEPTPVDLAVCASSATTFDDPTCTEVRRLMVDRDNPVRFGVPERIEIDGTTTSCHAVDQLCTLLAATESDVLAEPMTAKPAKPNQSLAADAVDGRVRSSEPGAVVVQRCTNDQRCDPPMVVAADALDLRLADCACEIRVGSLDGSVSGVTLQG